MLKVDYTKFVCHEFFSHVVLEIKVLMKCTGILEWLGAASRCGAPLRQSISMD